MPIPIIDLFAGPGGLGEGFTSLRDEQGRRIFEIRLSVEKERSAHQTLTLRSFFRTFDGDVPQAYYDFLADKDRAVDTLYRDPRFADHIRHATNEARRIELSEDTHPQTTELVRQALKGSDGWVLIGGPPCQAYSVAGRARRTREEQREFEKDKRHFLYREYLRIIADHRPALFVMENVRGILTSTIGGDRIFRQILKDLAHPDERGPRYRIHSLAEGAEVSDDNHSSFLVRAEEHGIPQARHRVFVIGIREDVHGSLCPLLPSEDERSSVSTALNGLPPIRSRLSRGADSHATWLEALHEGKRAILRNSHEHNGSHIIRDLMPVLKRSLVQAEEIVSSGGHFVPYYQRILQHLSSKDNLSGWYHDPRLSGVTCHDARSHMRSDLYRYLYAASFAEIRNASPKLRDFPAHLLPDHKNAILAFIEHRTFTDRFRVQCRNNPSTTVVSHISKDGHYFIHPDPAQCRSLTVREAARLQTFPDNYHFEGNRTEQYVQVGNAVPPFLARKIAKVVYAFLSGKNILFS